MYLEATRKVTITLIALIAIAGCGYHFEGMGLMAPEGVSTIAITVLENRTSESGIETVFTSDLVYEFTRSKTLRVVARDVADATLGGRITSLREDTISHTSRYESDERRVIIRLDLALKRADGTIIWSDRALSDKEAFKVNPSDRIETERNKREAIETMSERVAEKIHNRILQGF